MSARELERHLTLAEWHIREARCQLHDTQIADNHVESALEYAIMAGCEIGADATEDEISSALITRRDELGMLTPTEL